MHTYTFSQENFKIGETSLRYHIKEDTKFYLSDLNLKRFYTLGIRIQGKSNVVKKLRKESPECKKWTSNSEVREKGSSTCVVANGWAKHLATGTERQKHIMTAFKKWDF